MELVMQTTEHQRVAILRKQRIATLLGEINVHVVGNGPAMVCWPSLLMTGQMWRGQLHLLAQNPKMGPRRPPRARGNLPLNRRSAHLEKDPCRAPQLCAIGLWCSL